MRTGKTTLTIVLLVVCAIAAWGQLYTASVTGVVQDPSGAVIPGAKITLVDIGRNYSYPAVTDAQGRYLLRALPPGQYSLRVDAEGFARFELKQMTLDVNASVTANASLAVATAGQSVEVIDTGAPLLQTEDSVTGQTLNRTFINNLPLINRQVYDLAMLAPGVTQGPGATYGNPPNTISTNFVSNGGRAATADVLLDGVSSTAQEQNTSLSKPMYTPPVEAVQEFRLQQSNFSAEMGVSGATVVNVITRSGTNTYHGSLFEFLRNEKFDANNFFNNATGTAITPNKRNDYGGTFGGPVIENKTFFFFDYNGVKSRTGATKISGVPSAAERNGDFGELCGNAGGTFDSAGLCSVGGGQIWDRYTAVGGDAQNFIPFNDMRKYQSPGNPASQPLPASVGNLINPVAQKIMSYYPLPNIHANLIGTTGYNQYYNNISTGVSLTNQYSYDIKIDHRFTDNDLISARYSRYQVHADGANVYHSLGDTGSQGPYASDTHFGALNYTRTLSPTTILSISAGYGHNWYPTAGIGADFPDQWKDAVQTLGMPSYILSSGYNNVPGISINNGEYGNVGFNGNIGGQGWSILKYASETAHLTGSVSRTMGSHELKVGGEMRRHRINFLQSGEPSGIYAVAANGTSHHSWWDGGDSMATMLMGTASVWDGYEIPVAVATQSFDYAGFVQDNWRVNEHLTLNIGLRYDVSTPKTERYDRLSWFDPTAASPIQVPGYNLKGAVQFAGDNGNPRTASNTNYGGVGPRFGFAYRMGKGMTLRGGYGIFYDPTNQGASGTGPGSFTPFIGTTPSYTTNGDGVPLATMSNPWPNGLVQAPGKTQGAGTYLGQVLGTIAVRNINQLPYEQTWSLGVQRQLPGGFLLDTEYVGRKGTHLYFAGDQYLTYLTAGQAADFRANPGTWLAQVPNPFHGLLHDPSNGSLMGATVPYWMTQVQYPQYNNGSSSTSVTTQGIQTMTQPVANSIYHSLQMRLERRFSNGLQVLATYTNQKSIDDSSIQGSNTAWMGGFASVQDPNNRRIERSLSEYDISQVVSISGVYQLPFGRGKKFGSTINPILNHIAGGWQINGTYRWDTGMPFSLNLPGNGSPLPTFGGQRPNLLATPVVAGDYSSTLHYFADAGRGASNIASAPAAYALGNAPRVLPNVRVPGTNNMSMAMFKDFPLAFREGAKLQFRAESFNLFNRVQFGGPNNNVGDGNFGLITSQANSPREIQLGLKLEF